MLINSPEVKRTVDDYDFCLTGGMVMPVTIDEAIGDTVSFTPDGVVIHLAIKPSYNDPTKTLPAEDITIFTKHLLFVQHRRREITQLTPEQQHEWLKTLQEAGGTVM